jgi:DNA end-binding protein Ku
MPRPLWKGAISFGLVTIPVSLYPAKNARDTVTFHMLHGPDLRRVHNLWVDEEDHQIPYEEIVKGYEYEKDRYVVIAKADLEAASIKATQTIDIMHFVDGAEIDIAFYDTPYYTEPATMGRKAYALLRETLKKTGKMGVAKVVIRERQHLCAILADGPVILAYTLRWPYQLRGASDLDLPGEDLAELDLSPEELKMAGQLVEMMSSTWKPEQYRDTYREELLRLVSEKVDKGEITAAPPAPPREEREAEVIDIVALLKRSVEEHRAKAGEGHAS